MRIECVVLILMLFSPMTQLLSLAENSGDAGVTASIIIETPIPGYRCYRGSNFMLEAIISNGYGEYLNISIKAWFKPFETMWTNYSRVELEPGGNITYTWILRVPRDISYGNYTLGLNITYTVDSTTYSMYREAWLQVIPRNVSLLVADLKRNATGYYLVVSNPTMDPGQYIVENITVTLTAYNVNAIPHKIFVEKLYANSSYTIPLTISFKESDMGALTVNITTRDDVHGLVYFNYTFIVVNATAQLDLYVINDYGEPLPGAVVTIANRTYTIGPNGSLSLVMPVGIYDYSIEYRGHVIAGELALYTGFNKYTAVIDLTSPIITAVKQRGFGILVSAYDPGANCSGISSIIFVQGADNWTYTFNPQKNLTMILYPPLKTGSVRVIVIDSQNNRVNTTFEYVAPRRTPPYMEAVLITSIAMIVLTSLIMLSRNY